jgi:N-acetylmuramoyl-L-alanine amidase
MKRRSFPLICFVLLAMMANGCATRRADQDLLYARLVEEPEALDWSVLEGRTIVIDPGHGGRFDGVIGLDSLREADANLGVALYLWGLLDEAGADVHLTRTTDRDFALGDSTDLTEDLRMRTEKANSFEPEVFVSIHHNSNIELDRERNGLEIYYRSTDHGASLELARDFHTHLARNLGIEDSKIEPGNYFVLRNSAAQASVLGEASYLSNPSVEGKLKLSQKQKLEAEAYFLGLITYFSRGVPVVERIYPARDTLPGPEELLFRVTRGGNVPVDVATAVVRVGSHRYEPVYDPLRSVFGCALEQDLPNGEYETSCTVRSVLGATGSSRPYTLLLSRPARFVLPLAADAMVGNTVSLSLKVLDDRGAPVADGTQVEIRPIGSEKTIRARCTKGLARIETDSALADIPHVVVLPGLIDTLLFPVSGGGFEPSLVIDAGTRAAVRGAQAHDLSGAERTLVVRGDSDGILRLPAGEADRQWLVSAPGYRPILLEGGASELIEMPALFGGLLKGLRVAIDPAGGGSDHGGLGAGKSRGSSLNLEAAKRLTQLLRRCGAAVLLTRLGEETVSNEERIFKANRFRADLAIRLDLERDDGTDGSGCTVFHYPGSARGEALAASLSFSMQGLPPCDEWSMAASANRFLQQTSCPAVEIRNGTILSRESETIFSHPSYAALEAERILWGLLLHAGGGAIRPVSRSIRVLAAGAPAAGAAVTIDNSFTHYTDRTGTARFICLEPGDHLLLVEPPGKAPSLTTLRIAAGADTTITVSVP